MGLSFGFHFVNQKSGRLPVVCWLGLVELCFFREDCGNCRQNNQSLTTVLAELPKLLVKISF